MRQKFDRLNGEAPGTRLHPGRPSDDEKNGKFFLPLSTAQHAALATRVPFFYISRMIEKVGYTKPVTTARPTRKAESADGASFISELEKAEGVKAAAPTAPVGSIGSLAGLVGINEVDEREHKRRQAMKRGRFTLEALEQLRNALLMGSLPVSTLRNLEKLVAEERGATHDPLLNSLLDDIELRAAVEMAKLEMSGISLPQ